MSQLPFEELDALDNAELEAAVGEEVFGWPMANRMTSFERDQGSISVRQAQHAETHVPLGPLASRWCSDLAMNPFLKLMRDKGFSREITSYEVRFVDAESGRKFGCTISAPEEVNRATCVAAILAIRGLSEAQE